MNDREREQQYFEFITDHPNLDIKDVEKVFPDWETLCVSYHVQSQLHSYRVNESRKKERARRRTQELREYIDEAKRKAIAELVKQIDDPDKNISQKACMKIAGSEFVYKAKRAEKEAEAEFQASLPSDQEYPDV